MKELFPKELEAYISEASSPPVFLDVREQWEYDIVHFPNSKLIPMAQLSVQLDELDLDTEFVVVCHHGIRSRNAALYMEQHGFKKVINLKGGIDAWADEVDRSMPTYD